MSPALHIAIPETSIAHPPNEKPFTQYHVVLQLPLRRQEIKRRYRDFIKLHEDLVAQTGSSPPVALPAKRWFFRTVNNDSLTEERRVDLERYLRSIIDADDGRWRSAQAWRLFLGLQTDAVADVSDRIAETKIGQTRPQTMDPNEWLELHRKLKTKVQEARQQIKQREKANTVQQQHRVAAEAKSTLIRAATMVEELDIGLGTTSNKESGNGRGSTAISSLGTGEWRRRKDMLSAAKKEIQALDSILRAAAQQPDSVRRSTAAEEQHNSETLLAGRSKSGGRVLGGPAQETQRTRELDNDGVLQLQQQIMQEQDEDVLVLGQTITKLKDMGILMNEELAIQNEMLRVVEEDVDRVQAKVDVGRKRIQKIR